MRNKNYGYIYKTVNITNKKIYVGKKKGKFNPNYFGSGMYLKRAINKYGKNNFKLEVIIYTTNKKKLNQLEKKYIEEYRKLFGKNKLYNIADGGIGGIVVHPRRCQCISCKNKRKEKHNINCSCLMCKSIRKEEHKQNCQCAWCKAKRGEYKGEGNPMNGHNHTEVSKAKISQKNFEHYKLYGTRRITLETRQKIKEIRLKQWQDPEYRKKMLNARKNRVK